jgi:hypothetical protein
MDVLIPIKIIFMLVFMMLVIQPFYDVYVSVKNRRGSGLPWLVLKLIFSTLGAFKLFPAFKILMEFSCIVCLTELSPEIKIVCSFALLAVSLSTGYSFICIRIKKK